MGEPRVRRERRRRAAPTHRLAAHLVGEVDPIPMPGWGDGPPAVTPNRVGAWKNSPWPRSPNAPPASNGV